MSRTDCRAEAGSLGIEGAEVKEVACQAAGAELCTYEIRWSV